MMTKLKQAVKIAPLQWKKKMVSTSCWLTAYDIIHLNMFLSHEKPLYMTSPCTQLHTHTHKNTLNASVRSQFQSVCPWLSVSLVRLMLRRTWLSLGCQYTHPYTHTRTNNYNSIRVVLFFFGFFWGNKWSYWLRHRYSPRPFDHHRYTNWAKTHSTLLLHNRLVVRSHLIGSKWEAVFLVSFWTEPAWNLLDKAYMSYLHLFRVNLEHTTTFWMSLH